MALMMEIASQAFSGLLVVSIVELVKWAYRTYKKQKSNRQTKSDC